MSRRAYDNTLRAEQAADTRRRILESARDLLAAANPLTVPDVAAKAGVSEPTVYRHFPNRTALLEAVAEFTSELLGEPRAPKDPSELPDLVIAVARYFGKNAAQMRAAMNDPYLREVRESGRKGRVKKMRAVLEPAAAHLDEREQELAFAVFETVIRGDTWDHLTRGLGLTDDEAGRAMAWTVQSLLDSLAAKKRAKHRHLVDEDTVARGQSYGETSIKSRRRG